MSFDKEKMRSKFVAGEMIYYNDDTERAMYYLDRDLDRDEARVFIIAARERGRAPFEDDREGQYTLHYEHGTYYLSKR